MSSLPPVLTSALIAFLLCGSADGQTVAAPSPETVLSTLEPNHPRLLLKKDGMERLKQQAVSDTLLRKYIGQVIGQADACLTRKPLEHVLIGPRLLSVSRECLERTYMLGMAWRLTGEEKYARAAEENLLTVCAFPDWNPSHFLDTAEMSHAVGVGYDWLYPVLSADSREKIRRGLIELGMKPGVAAYTGEKGPAWWALSEFNWNMVCNCGLLIGALSIAETNPDYARLIVPKAVASLPIALASYAPDGAWGEGPGYWDYATRYVAYGLSSLESALGTDFGLSQAQGLAESGLFPIYTTGPTGLFLNFADSGENARREPSPCVFWASRTFGNAFLADSEHALITGSSAQAQHLIWYVPPSGKRTETQDLDRRFRGKVDVAVFRSGWGPDDLFVGVKGGYNQVNHGHLDLGNFELDALGERWARDLGSDDYNLPNYWEGKKDGRRWIYYRLNSLSHSVPLLNGRSQDEQARAEVKEFVTMPHAAHVIIDISSAYVPVAKSVLRGVAMVGNRKAALVQDEFELAGSSDITWAMTTDADITLRGDTALLRLNGKELTARILSPKGSQFAIESAEQQPPQKSNTGVKRLLVPMKGHAGKVRIAVLLAPKWEDGKTVKKVEIAPLAEW